MAEQPGNSKQRRLMIRGALTADAPRATCALVERGMVILSREGQEVGKVAAVSVDEEGVVEAILLSRLPAERSYHLVPAGFVRTVRNGDLILTVAADVVDGLEKRANR